MSRDLNFSARVARAQLNRALRRQRPTTALARLLSAAMADEDAEMRKRLPGWLRLTLG